MELTSPSEGRYSEDDMKRFWYPKHPKKREEFFICRNFRRRSREITDVQRFKIWSSGTHREYVRAKLH